MSDLPATPTPEPGPVRGPRRPVLALDRTLAPGVATALGVALVAAAVVLSAVHSRQGGDLDGSNFTMGVLATLGLLAVAVAAHLLAPAAERAAALVSWPGAAGALAVAVMLMVLIDDDTCSPYAGAVVAVVLSAGGYLVTRAAPFVLGTIAGLALLYAKAFDDLFSVGGGRNAFMAVGAGVLVFVVVVTAVGWLLPATRVLSGVVVGVGGLVALVAVLVAVTIFRVVTSFASGMVSFGSGSSSADGSVERGFSGYSPLSRLVHQDPYRNDVWMILLYCALLAVLWAVCALATGHVGFRLLLVADGVLIIPLATYALLASHPTWWEVVCTGVGGLVLLGVGWHARRETPTAAPPAGTAPAAPAPPAGPHDE
jgi:hypothetical protein